MDKNQNDIDDIVIYSNNILAFIKIILFILIISSFYYEFQTNETYEFGTNAAWCGTPERKGEQHTKGKSLFINNCATCHATNMQTTLTGPALEGTLQRWAEFPRSDLYQWIRDSQKMIKKKHPRAKKLWSEWKPTIMNSFNHLNDEEIKEILDYIDS